MVNVKESNWGRGGLDVKVNGMLNMDVGEELYFLMNTLLNNERVVTLFHYQKLGQETLKIWDFVPIVHCWLCVVIYSTS